MGDTVGLIVGLFLAILVPRPHPRQRKKNLVSTVCTCV